MDINTFLKTFKTSGAPAPAGDGAAGAADASTRDLAREVEEILGDGAVSDSPGSGADGDHIDADESHGGSGPDLGHRGKDRYARHGESAGGPRAADFEALKVYHSNADDSSAHDSTASGKPGLRARRQAPVRRTPAVASKRLRSESADAYWKELLAERKKYAASTALHAVSASEVTAVSGTSASARLDEIMVSVDDLLESSPILAGIDAAETSPPQAQHAVPIPSGAHVAAPEEVLRRSTPVIAQQAPAPNANAGQVEAQSPPPPTLTPPQPPAPEQVSRPKKVSMFARAKALQEDSPSNGH